MLFWKTDLFDKEKKKQLKINAYRTRIKGAPSRTPQ